MDDRGDDLAEDDIERLVSEVHDYQLTHGSLLKLVRHRQPHTVPARPVGVSLRPTQMPRRTFDDAIRLQTSFDELYVRAACDHKWLLEAAAPFVKRDRFVSALWKICLQVQDADPVQRIVCGVFRSDYMLHVSRTSGVAHENLSNCSLRQVEMNTFSVAGACHADRVAAMHGHLRRVRLPAQTTNSVAIVQLLSSAHQSYARGTSGSACVLMVVQPDNFNIADERPIEYGLWQQGIPCYRCEWQDILQSTTLNADRTLLFRPAIRLGHFEVSVIYYRAGYELNEYNEAGMRTRTRLELSRSIKCPDIFTHLTTFKAIQQALSQTGAVERFLDVEASAAVRRTFMYMQVLDDSAAGQEGWRLASHPRTAKDFVLKPNLEGGGNNIYREAIPPCLSSIPRDEWANFILMRLIEPPSIQGLLMTTTGLCDGDVVSELGVIGTCIWQQGGEKVEIIENGVAGWTFKTKPKGVNEMSVVKGYGCFDSPLLVD